MAVEVERFGDLVALEPHGPDVYVGVSPEYPWERVYGGQVVAQGLAAAADTVPEDYAVHSLHAYFIRGGTSDEPIRYEVDRIRNGRSFVTRRVVARQSGGAILNLSASFHRREDEAEVALVGLPADIALPDELPNDDWGSFIERRTVPNDSIEASSAAWLRLRGPLGDNPLDHALAMAYASDDVPTEAAAHDHPDMPASGEWDGRFMSASLDHGLWFHHHARADEWQLHILDGLGLNGGRGLSFGHVLALDGTHVASVSQQILLRRARP